MKHLKMQATLLIVFFTILSCVNDKKEKIEDVQLTSIKSDTKTTNDNLNISFLLDLSDRISPEVYANETMEFYKRDVAYIKSVSEAFDTHLRTKRVRQMNDHIQVFFDPEPQNSNINKISKDLKYFIDRKTASLELLDEIKNTYSNKPELIYQLAIEDNKYIGSDTWKFFKNKVKDYCVDENYRNILVILTDGYIYHKDTKRKEANKTTYLTANSIKEFRLNRQDWENRIVEMEYGFIPATKDLSNLEILVLGVNPDKNNSYEQEVIVKYWSDWFETMNVKRYVIKSAGLPSNMDKIIKDFILIN